MKKIHAMNVKTQIDFAIGIASMDGGKPSAFTEKLLKQYEIGQLSASELKQVIVKNIQGLHAD